ncbi:MAG: hypothetical protein H7239_01970 [Flavobacterium sp.]|nr:hypothetical protein [Flavobacterium sp.]
MKATSLYFLLLILAFLSCKDDSVIEKASQQKEAQKKEVIFDNISKAWIFVIPSLESSTQSSVNNWIEWRAFLTEINQKPKSSIGAFQNKSSALSKKVADLDHNIPKIFDKPQVKSRILVLITKIKAMDLFIHLNQIPDKKVIQFIAEINAEINSLQKQLEEIIIRTKIPKEAGEPDLIRMKDTARAIPNTNQIIK